MAMKISEVMTRDVEIASPEDTIHTAARMMADTGAGALPIGENDRLVGMVTDRDITIRAVAEGRSPDECKLREVMTAEVRYIFEDEDVAEAAHKMAEWQVRRLPVLNREKRLVGIISTGDLAFSGEKEHVGEAMEGIAQPTERHQQSAQSEMSFAGNKPKQK
jgi:CBS domain-containing protein